MTYVDHFGTKSAEYLQFRPNYPVELFDYLSGLVTAHDLAWDCGTGNGQAAASLASYFKEVVATDINQPQLELAIQKPNIRYLMAPCDKSTLSSHSVDCVTVAQALHWFEFDNFYTEVKRVLKPNGIFAAWCYPLGKISPEIDKIILRLYEGILGPYWPTARTYIDKKYQTIPFPFEKIDSPIFRMRKNFTFSEFLGYLSTWSALKEFEKQNHSKPLETLQGELLTAWGDPTTVRIMNWPIYLLVGKHK